MDTARNMVSDWRGLRDVDDHAPESTVKTAPTVQRMENTPHEAVDHDESFDALSISTY